MDYFFFPAFFFPLLPPVTTGSADFFPPLAFVFFAISTSLLIRPPEVSWLSFRNALSFFAMSRACVIFFYPFSGIHATPGDRFPWLLHPPGPVPVSTVRPIRKWGSSPHGHPGFCKYDCNSGSIHRPFLFPPYSARNFAFNHFPIFLIISQETRIIGGLAEQ